MKDTSNSAQQCATATNCCDFTHFDTFGRASMVNVEDKPTTKRLAIARGRITMSAEALDLVKSGGIKKGDVFSVSQVAGIMAAKRTGELIPMCHNIFLSCVEITFDYLPNGIEILASVRAEARTGVEMEALTAVSVSALTIYDMVKAIDRTMVISDIALLKKEGGKSGLFVRNL